MPGPPRDEWDRPFRCGESSSPRGTGQRRLATRRLATRQLAPALPGVELHVLGARREGIARDEAEPRFFHAPAHARDEGELVDRREHRPLVDEPLHAMQDRLAFRTIQLRRLFLEEAKPFETM